MDEAVAFIKHTFATQGPFDGVFAFSQGASFLSVLCALRKGEGRPEACDAIDFDFAVFVSGWAERRGKKLFVAWCPLPSTDAETNLYFASQGFAL